jgi:hypothetical protein
MPPEKSGEFRWRIGDAIGGRRCLNRIIVILFHALIIPSMSAVAALPLARIGDRMRP